MGYVSTKISAMLKRLLLDLERDGPTIQSQVINHCRYLVHENVGYDRYDGGRDGQGITLFVSEATLSHIPLAQQEAVQQEFALSLGSLIPSAAREYIHEVRIELADEGDVEFQKATPFGTQPIVNPSSLPFWKPGQIRLFISHRDKHKSSAHKLALALKPFGVSSFVAHDEILPMREWRKEILSGLQTMEVFLAFLTDDFHESYWCQQEVGYAIGKGIPVISLKLEKADPPGFIDNVQALKGKLASPDALAGEVYRLIGKGLGVEERLRDGIVSAFIQAEDFQQVRSRFEFLKANVPKLTDAQADMVAQGYSENEILYRAIYLNNHHDRLTTYMSKATDAEWEITNNVLRRVEKELDWDDGVPF